MLKKLTLFFLLTSFSVGAQNIDSTDVGFVTLNQSTLQTLDTTLSLESYLNYTDYGIDEFGIISMGSQGDVRRRLSFNPQLSISPNLGIDGYFKNCRNVLDVPFYNVKVPTGGIRFLKGYDKGQMFGGFFTVNPSPRLNAFIDYRRINSRGNYFNQQNKADHVLMSFRFSDKKDFYRLSAALSFNSFANYEFGGIANVEEFENNTFSNRELIPVNLQSSFSNQRSTESFINQSVRLIRFDSISELRFLYNFSFSGQSNSFSSSDSVFVDSALFDISPIRDSIRTQRVDNLMGIAFNAGRTNFFGGVNYSYYKYGNAYLLNAENLLGLKFGSSGAYKGSGYDASFENTINGSYQGSYVLDVEGYFKSKGGNWVFKARGKNGLYNPGLFTQQYVSNNFVWNNAFRQILESTITGEISFKKTSLACGVRRLNNYVYFNHQALPTQFIGAINAFHVDLSVRFKLAKGVYFDNKLRYQKTDHSDIIRIPDMIYRGILYYEFSAFKNALNMHFGTEFKYFSSFASEAYNPSTTVMYLQDEISIGDFPYFNFFLDFKIDEFVFFVRLENITQGFFEYNYYAAPLYPLPDFSFRFGAAWRFFN